MDFKKNDIRMFLIHLHLTHQNMILKESRFAEKQILKLLFPENRMSTLAKIIKTSNLKCEGSALYREII